MAELIKPKQFTVEDMDGTPVTVTLSRFDAVEGREILAKYPMSAMPKLGDYDVNEETMLKLMSYIAVDANGTPLRLTTKALINNHTHDAETLMKIEMAMLEYNCSFFQQGRISDFLEEFVQMIIAKISKISIRSSEPSLIVEKPPSTNSGQSTT